MYAGKLGEYLSTAASVQRRMEQKSEKILYAGEPQPETCWAEDEARTVRLWAFGKDRHSWHTLLGRSELPEAEEEPGERESPLETQIGPGEAANEAVGRLAREVLGAEPDEEELVPFWENQSMIDFSLNLGTTKAAAAEYRWVPLLEAGGLGKGPGLGEDGHQERLRAAVDETTAYSE